MAFVKQSFSDGQILTAYHMNRIQNGLEEAYNEIKERKEDLNTTKKYIIGEESYLYDTEYTVIQGQWWNDAGKLHNETDPSYKAVDYVPIPDNVDRIKTNALIPGYATNDIIFYDAGKNYIGYAIFGSADDTIEKPYNAKYLTTNISVTGNYSSDIYFRFYVKTLVSRIENLEETVKAANNEEATPALTEIFPSDYGAIYDGVTDCSSAINQCLEIGGLVHLVGDGTALCKSPLIFKTSNTMLLLDDGFTVKLDNGVNNTLVETVGGQYYYNDANVGKYRLKNISIVGGIYDLNGNNQVKPGQGYFETVAGMRIADVDNLVVKNITLKNPVTYGMALGGLQNFDVSDIYMDYYGRNVINMDGLHFSGNIYDGTIQSIFGVTHDDMVALNVSADGNSMLRKGDAKRIVIRNVIADGSLRAVRLLCGVDYTIDDVLIENVYGTYDYTGVIAITSWNGQDAKFGTISIKNIKTSTVNNGSIVKIGEEWSDYKVYVDTVSIDNLELHNASNYTIEFKKNSICNNITLTNSKITSSEDLSGRALITGDGSVKRCVISNCEIGTSDNPIGTLIGVPCTTQLLIDSSIYTD